MKISPAAKTRLDAAQRLTDVIVHGKSLDVEDFQNSLTKALCFGVCRFYFELSFFRDKLLQSPLKKSAALANQLLLTGLFELHHQSTKTHAVINETVNAAKTLKQPWAAKLINGVLRNFERQKTTLMAELENHPPANFAHPQWLVDCLYKAYGKQAEAILRANNQQAPMTLRVNLQKTTQKDYLTVLEGENIQAKSRGVTALQLSEPTSVSDLPNFSEGFVSVQDGAPQLAAHLLNAHPQQRVLDACAAPGNKTCHILEKTPTLSALVAVDISDSRLNKLRDNVQRLDLNNTPLDIRCADVGDVDSWWDGQQFNRILLDAPCSATGVIRRHPDIKLLRKASDIQALAKRQTELLETLWPLLAPDGMLLYATCSILPEENEEQMAGFFQRHKDAKAMPLKIPFGTPLNVGHQILPGEDDCDGFYYCGVEKT